MLRRRMPMLADAHISSLGYLWLYNLYESYHLSGPPLETLQCDRKVSIGQPQGNGQSLYKIATFSKSKKNGGEGPYQKERLWGEAPLGTLKMSFLFLRFFNDLRDGPFYFWGRWGCGITEKILHQRSKRKKNQSCSRKDHLGASLISFMNDISNC